jgi:hypothetical protein
MPRSRHRVGRPYRRARAQMFRLYGYVCHICGHGGANEADHLVPISVDSGQPIDPHAMRPSHGSSRPCRVCQGPEGKPRCCNQERGNKALGQALKTSEDW